MNTVATRYTPYIWSNLLAWMNELDVAGETLNAPEYQDEETRNVLAREQPDIREAVARVIAKVPANDAMRRAQSFGLTWAVVRAPEENYDEPHWNERGFFMPIQHEELPSPVPYPGRLFHCEETPFSPTRPPKLGEHTQDILRELGVSNEQVEQYRQQGVIR